MTVDTARCYSTKSDPIKEAYGPQNQSTGHGDVVRFQGTSKDQQHFSRQGTEVRSSGYRIKEEGA